MKGDRFTRMVEKALKHRVGSYSNDMISSLLRKEYAAVRRVVKKHVTELSPSIVNETWGMGYRQACSDILAALDKRAKEGK